MLLDICDITCIRGQYFYYTYTSYKTSYTLLPS